MRLFYSLLSFGIAGIRIGWGVLAWLWVASGLVVVLGALPWIELTVPELWRWLALLTFLLTLSGVGPGYFARRTQSLAWRRALDRLTHLSRVVLRRTLKVAAVYCAICFLLLFVIGFAGFALLLVPVAYWVQKSSPEQALFARGSQQLVLRDGKMVALRPLVPGFQLVTHLASEDLDSSWVAVLRPTPPLIDLPSDIIRTQTLLLADAHQARLEAAEERRAQVQQAAYLAAKQATEQALGYDVLHFDLDDDKYALSGERSLHMLRSPLDSVRYSYVKLSSTGTLRLLCNSLGANNETLTLVIAPFKGPGSYVAAAQQGAASDANTLELQRYVEGVGTTFTTRSDKPVHVEITLFDTQQRVVEGTFEGQLYNSNGAMVAIENGEFALRFNYFRPYKARPH
jgi:hypothetical protein